MEKIITTTSEPLASPDPNIVTRFHRNAVKID
jgi:hypothetical protein